ncbi:MAG: hypothetical protein ABIK65_07620, partial [Candidatus Eisenbacteria bacterium]
MTRKLGAFLGVYTPTVLTILGVIMYLRFGWLAGHLGLARILLVVALANSITLITTLAFSSVATNVRVGVGGAYYIVSRSLGIEIGGAIGLPLFLSQALSVTLYSFGFAESLRIVWPGVPIPVVTGAVIVFVALLAAPGARIALRAQVPLLGLVALSIGALAVGALMRRGGTIVIDAPPLGEIGFWAAFAIFFPAVTGVMAGLGLSGDLADPGRSIPRGSLFAVGTGFAVYLIIPVVLLAGASAADLRSDSMIWTRIAILGPWFVLPGLWSAIFSSAVGSVLSAPRTLQALARDGLAPRFLGKVTGDWREIVPGMAVTVVIALGAVFLGDLNAVASLVTMFFLTVYGTINLVSAFEALSGDPSWRPRLRIPWPVALAGAVLCGVAMFLISPVAGAVAVLAEFLLWLVLSRKERSARWGDARRGLYENLIRWALVNLAERPMSARNWRPHVLVFAQDPLKELDLVRFGDWFSQGRGVVTVCRLVVGDLLIHVPDRRGMRLEMQEFFDAENLTVFAEVDVVPDVVDGLVSVAQANGMAGIASNMVLLGWPGETSLQVQFLQVMSRLEALNKSLVLARIHPHHLYRPRAYERTIHVWWGGLQRNGDLMLLLAHLLTRNPEWRNAKVRVMSVATSEVMKSQTEMILAKLIPEIRIQAEARVILKPKEMSVTELIHQESREAEVVVLGLATPEEGKEEEYAVRLEKLAGELPTVFFVRNASLFMGGLVGETEKASPLTDSRSGKTAEEAAEKAE